MPGNRYPVAISARPPLRCSLSRLWIAQPNCHCLLAAGVPRNGSAHRGRASIRRLQGAWKNLILVHTPVTGLFVRCHKAVSVPGRIQRRERRWDTCEMSRLATFVSTPSSFGARAADSAAPAGTPRSKRGVASTVPKGLARAGIDEAVRGAATDVPQPTAT